MAWRRGFQLLPSEPTPLEEQLYRYATEVHDLYREVREEKAALAEEKLVLEYRVKELTSLNRLFQQHMESKQQMEEALDEIAAQLQTLLKEKLPPQIKRQLTRLLSQVRSARSGAVENPGAKP